jgi:hypothetical protein
MTPSAKRNGRQPSVGAMAALAAACAEIYAANLVILYPAEPHPSRRSLLESQGVLVGVSPLVDGPRVFTAAMFRKWLVSHAA